MKPEVKSLPIRICISYNRKGHRALAVFLLSFFIRMCRRESDQSYMDKLFIPVQGCLLDMEDEAVDIAETVIHTVMVDRLKAALPLLLDGEQAGVAAFVSLVSHVT